MVTAKWKATFAADGELASRAGNRVKAGMHFALLETPS